MYIPTGIEHVVDILNKSTWFLVYADPDIDGVVSSEETMRFLDYFKKPYQYHINENRQHGFKIPKEKWANLIGSTVLLVDAGISLELMQELVDYGINVINLDHHNIKYTELVVCENTEKNTKGVMINNNYAFEPREYTFLSGAGVVYYTLKAIADIFTDEDRALVGLTLLSDIRDLSTDKAKEFLHYTYTTRTPYLDWLLEITKPVKDWGFGEITLNRNYIDFTFSPKINAMFRCNYGDEVVDIFRGRYDSDNLRLEAVRDMQKVVIQQLLQNILVQEHSNLYFCTIPDSFRSPTGIDITNLIGITCSKLVDKGKTTIMLVTRPDGSVKRGSLRGLCHDVDYLNLLRKHGVKAEGHSGAFGILEFNPNRVNIEELNKEINALEHGYAERKYHGRIFEANNLSFFIGGSTFHQMAEYNNYVRDNERLYIKYKGKTDHIEKIQSGAKITYKVDGVNVQCFDETLTVGQDLLLPIIERGDYKSIFLRRY